MSCERSAYLSRRLLLWGASAAPLSTLGSVACQPTPAPTAPQAKLAPKDSESTARFAQLERSVGGRLGVAALDTSTGARVGFRADERFAMCSTFKLALVGAVLARIDAGQERLSRGVPFGESDLLEYAPITRTHVSEGSMTVEALCEAAITMSDNTAANLLLASLSGPAGLTAFFRTLGDTTSRLDRTEPMLNTAIAGDERDTTTPHAMLGTMHALLVGEALSASSRARLLAWLVATKTGLSRLRAGFPAAYRAGDKTGTGENGAVNDLTIAWPPARTPLLVAAYTMGSSASTEQLSAALANAAKIVLAELGLV
jgi:beta-lactamase class A